MARVAQVDADADKEKSKMRFNIKKSDITASLVIIITCVLLMIMLWLRTSDGGGTAPSYSFLGGRNPITCKKANGRTEDSRGKEDIRYTYSFEADFNDVCSKADAELIPAGFVGKTLLGNEYHIRYYLLKGRFPRGPICIYINNLQYIEFPNSKKGAIGEKDGLVMIEIIYFRGWRWPF
jgi:hypothetical protein